MDRDQDFLKTIADLRQRVAQLEAVGASQGGVTAEAWHNVGGGGEPAFQNSWVNTGGGIQVLRFRKEKGRVFVEGFIKSGATGTVVFNLPAGYRPTAIEQRLARVINSLDGLGGVNIVSGGDVTMLALNGTGTITAASFGFDFPID